MYKGEYQGQVKLIQPHAAGSSPGTLSEVHMAPDVVDLFHHLPDVFSPSRKNNPKPKSEGCRSHQYRNEQERKQFSGRSREWEQCL